MKLVLLGVVAFIILGGGYYTVSSGQKQEKMAMEAEMKKDPVPVETPEQNESKDVTAEMNKEATKPALSADAMGTDTDTEMMMDAAMMKPAAVSPATVGTYEVYREEKIAMAATSDVVLFFKATWCPSCRALDADIKANLSDIPAELTILEVDYDTATALRQQYGVTTQHTLVQVAADGTLIKKWSGGSTLSSVVQQVQ